MLSNPISYQEPLRSVVNLGWAHQVQQKQDLKWFKPTKSWALGRLQSQECAVFPWTLNKKLQALPKEWDLRSDCEWGSWGSAGRPGAPGFLQMFGQWCLCSLEMSHWQIPVLSCWGTSGPLGTPWERPQASTLHPAQRQGWNPGCLCSQLLPAPIHCPCSASLSLHTGALMAELVWQ